MSGIRYKEEKEREKYLVTQIQRHIRRRIYSLMTNEAHRCSSNNKHAYQVRNNKILMRAGRCLCIVYTEPDN